MPSEPTIPLSLDDRIGLDLLKKGLGSFYAICLMMLVNLFVELSLPLFGAGLISISAFTTVVVFARTFSLWGAVHKKAYPRNEIRFVQLTVLPVIALIVTSVGLLLYETGFSGPTRLIPLIEICGISVTSMFTVATHLKTCRALQTLATGAILLPMALIWRQTHNSDLLSLSLIFLALYAYLVIQAGFAHKQAVDKFKYEISLEEANLELEESRLRILEETAKAENASRLASLGEMAGGIAHEINNPLTVISLLANKLEKSAAKKILKSDHIIENTKKIEETCVRISKIIRGLRSFSRNGDHDAFEVITVEKLCSQVLDFASGRLDNSAINVIVEHEDPGAEIECRSVQMSQVLVNVLNNAVDAIDGTEDPWVRIETQRRSLNSTEAWAFRVTDSGKGIAPEIRPRIFEPFFTTKKAGKGTGLGLSISLGLLKQHHGNIFLDEAASNTSFLIELPKRQPQSLASPKNENENESENKQRITA